MSTSTRTVLTSADGEKLMLTPRQLEVLNLIADGLTYKQIERRLGIAPATVKSHVSAVLQILGVSNRTKAAIKALRYARDRPLQNSRGRASSRCNGNCRDVSD